MKHLLLIALFLNAGFAQPQRWSEKTAADWYAKQPWLVGSNYIPATAINELEMWQADSFDPQRIDTELGWAESLGMNTMRVFLHDLLWQQDAPGFKKRMDEFLTIADKHKIRPMFVLFDSVWDPFPELGKQRAPKPGVHNSGWMQSPGSAALKDPAQYPRLAAYVKGVVGAFANDRRVLAWDIWNEPDNTNGGSYGKLEPANKVELVLALLPKAFGWARAAGASQPLTSGVWTGDWSAAGKLEPMARIQLDQSDMISFHSYDPPDEFEKRVQSLAWLGRPLVCTEYMARGNGSTFQGTLPIAKKYHVAAINWGLVQGKAQTDLPWDSWQRPYTDRQPAVWFHEVFYTDGRPYRTEEVEFIREITGKKAKGVAALAPVSMYEPQLGKSGLDLGATDTNVSPCTNFYQYACGNWRLKNPIPPDQSRWGRFNELSERNLRTEREILERAAVSSPGRSAIDQKIGDFYAACMDEKGGDGKGVDPIKPALDGINALQSKEQLAAELARLKLIGVNGVFTFFANADFKDASINVANIDQGGISLPDRDNYLKTDQRSVDLRNKYEQHVANMFDLLAKSLNTSWDSKAKAGAVLKFETALAEASMDRVARRNPESRDHPMTTKDLPDLTPNFQWTAFISDEHTPSFTKINVANPDFFKKLTSIIQQTSLDDLKSYLAWHLLLRSATALPQPFVEENFQFFGKTLNGQQELAPRWKRCVRATDRSLGEALGQKFVEVAFGGPARAKALQLVGAIEKSMKQDIETATWMSESTKQQAYAKLAAVSNKIGYPDKWRDYSSVMIKRDDYLGDEERAATFEIQRNLNKIGKPVDKSEWGMTPPTVNAYYSPPQNNINFPAGILQPPFYSAKADDAVNLGAIGVVVGHELTHGFDDQGRKYDGAGNLRDWWTPEDARNFEKRAECVVEEYDTFSPVDGVNLKGKLTLGENAADNGGIHLAYMALMRDLADKTMPDTKLDGLTPQQQFFLGFAQVWCENSTDASARVRAMTDPHSPGQFRTNGVVQNMKEFEQAFGCKEGDPMVSEKACRVW